jgi:hypothetical protein
MLLRNHIVCIHDANALIQPESYSRAFGLAHRTLPRLLASEPKGLQSYRSFRQICLLNTASASEKRSSSRPMAMNMRCGGMRAGHKFHSLVP